jgi:hypothetical protein
MVLVGLVMFSIQTLNSLKHIWLNLLSPSERIIYVKYILIVL